MSTTLNLDVASIDIFVANFFMAVTAIGTTVYDF